jgi:hypothetical protein
MPDSSNDRSGSTSTAWVYVAVGAVALVAAGAAFASMQPPTVLTTTVVPHTTSTVAPPGTTSTPTATETTSPTGAPGTEPIPSPAPEPAPRDGMPLPFDAARAMAHIKMLSVKIGQRVGGTRGEQRAVEYAAGQLRDLGYEVSIQDVPVDDGRTSHNVLAHKKGATGRIVLLGGHIDSKAPAPGADDNATGVGAVLELARDFASVDTGCDLRFAAFGHEELIGDGDSSHHHYGSRKYESSLSAEERGRFAAMVSIDMIGYGPDFSVRTMGVGPRVVADRLIVAAKTNGVHLTYLRDPGSSGWSDHEPFERAGLPAAWLEWRDDPNTHTRRDTYARLDRDKVGTTGSLVRSWVASLSARDLDALTKTR